MSYTIIFNYRELVDPNDNLLPLYSIIKSYGFIYYYKCFICTDLFSIFEMRKIY